jgi:hypothetical protein
MPDVPTDRLCEMFRFLWRSVRTNGSRLLNNPPVNISVVALCDLNTDSLRLLETCVGGQLVVRQVGGGVRMWVW